VNGQGREEALREKEIGEEGIGKEGIGAVAQACDEGGGEAEGTGESHPLVQEACSFETRPVGQANGRWQSGQACEPHRTGGRGRFSEAEGIRRENGGP
jgi:hypothetical protein